MFIKIEFKITADCYGRLVPGADISWVDRLDERSGPQQVRAHPHTGRTHFQSGKKTS
jgi:hypothetical protein